MGIEAKAIATDMGDCLCLEESHLFSVQSEKSEPFFRICSGKV